MIPDARAGVKLRALYSAALAALFSFRAANPMKNLLSRFLALFQAPPPTPVPPPIATAETIYTDDESPYYLSRNGRQLRFRHEGHRRLCRLIALSNKYPPRGTVGVYRDGEFALFDRTNNTTHPLEETPRDFKLAIRSLYRARLESPPAALDWDATP